MRSGYFEQLSAYGLEKRVASVARMSIQGSLHQRVASCPRLALLMRASVTGLDESIPFCVIHSPRTCFCTGSAQGRRLMEFVEDGPANLRKRDHILDVSTSRMTA
jgi:hypothetical protein